MTYWIDDDEDVDLCWYVLYFCIHVFSLGLLSETTK